MIITGGFNVYPSEVEHAIATLAAVQEVAMVGAPDPKWGEAITAVVVVRPGFTLTAEEVRAVCRQQLAPYKAPKRVEFWDTLPKSERGKILRRVVRDQYWAGRERQV